MARIPIKWAFTKWMIDDKGRNKIPAYFSGYIRNARIQNGSITVRKGRKYVIKHRWPVRNIIRGGKEWYVVDWNMDLFRSTDLISRTNIGYVWPATTSGEVNFISYWEYLIILNGNTPYYYKYGTGSAIVVPNANLTMTAPSPNLSNPIIWTQFTGFTFVAGGTASTENILYISKPILMDSPQNSFNWSTAAGATGAMWGNRVFTSRILGMVANYNNLYVFCEKTIEVISRSSISADNYGNNVTYSTPIGDWDILASHRSVVIASQKVFYLTKNLEIKCIWYTPWITDPQIGELSHREWQGIRLFMQDQLDFDQSKAYGYYNKRDNTIAWYLKSKGSAYNNICIIYDLVNDSFLVDELLSRFEYYICIAQWWQDGRKILGGNSNGDVYSEQHEENWVGYYRDDLSEIGSTPIRFEYNTPNISMWEPRAEKLFSWVATAWAMNTSTILNKSVYVDWQLQFQKQFTYNSIKNSEKKLLNIGGVDRTSWLQQYNPFHYVADQWMLRKKGKTIRVQYLCQTNDSDFYLDWLSINAEATGNVELNDKY